MQKYGFYNEKPYICLKNKFVSCWIDMEKLLHYIWKHRILPLKPLYTTDGRSVEIIDPGFHNSNQGPDFFNAKLRLGDTLWAGNVEIHQKSSDWFRHSHQEDASYNNVILHVVQDIDCEVHTQDGKQLPQVQLEIPSSVNKQYEELCRTDDYPRCHRMIPSLSPLKAHIWLDALLAERLQERSGRVLQLVKSFRGDWEKATFVALSRNFGFSLNGDAFERWATQIPLPAIGKHRDHLFQITSLFLGLAGLIDTDSSMQADQVDAMKKEYAFLSHKFGLTSAMRKEDWRYLRTRPQNFPHVRIRQLAYLYHRGQVQLASFLDAADIKSLHGILSEAGISVSSRRLIIINTVVPLLYAYGLSHHEEKWTDRAIRLLDELPAENNFILRQWADCGLSVRSAADSQALIQLKREYCDRLDCLRCRFAYEYLKLQSSI